jgi:chromosome segregation ATPase
MFLEGLAPGFCEGDRAGINSLMRSSTLFPQVIDVATRNELLYNLLEIECMIPTPHLVFEMLKHLEPACEILKKLADVGSKSTIRQCLIGKYTVPLEPPVEVGKEYYLRGQWNSERQTMEFLYVQLWVLCLRKFWEMTAFTPKKEKGQLTLKPKESNPALLSRLGDLTIHSGFATEQARIWQDLDRTESLVTWLKEQAQVGMGKTMNEGDKSLVRRALNNAARVSSRVNSVEFLGNTGIEQERRSGRPFHNNYDLYENEFFLWHLLGPLDNNSSPYARYMTYSFVRRQLIFLFFEKPTEDNPFSFSTLSTGVLGETPLGNESNEPSDPLNDHAQTIVLLDQLNTKIRELELQLNSQKSELEQLTTEKHSAERRLQSEVHRSATLQQKYDNSRKGDADTIKSLKEELQHTKIYEASTIREVRELRAAVESSQQNLTLQRTQHQQESERLLDLEKKTKDQAKEIMFLQSEIRNRETTIHQSADKVIHLKAEIEELKGNKDALQARETTIQKAADEVERLKIELKTNNDTLQAQESAIQQATNEVARLKTELKGNNDTLQARETALEQALDEATHLKAEIKELKSNNNALQGQESTIQQAVNESIHLKAEIKELKSNNEALKARETITQQANNEVARQKIEIEDLQRDSESYVQQATDEVKRLEAEIKKLKVDNETMRRAAEKGSDLHKEIFLASLSYKSEMESLQRKMKSYDSEAEQLSHHLSQILVGGGVSWPISSYIYFHFEENQKIYTYHCDRSKMSAVLMEISKIDEQKWDVFLGPNLRVSDLRFRYLELVGKKARCFWLKDKQPQKRKFAKFEKETWESSKRLREGEQEMEVDQLGPLPRQGPQQNVFENIKVPDQETRLAQQQEVQLALEQQEAQSALQENDG